MKKWIIRIAVGVIALLVIGIIVTVFFLGSIVKTGFETVGPKLTKVDMRLGAANISPFSGSCELKDMFIGNPEGFKTPSAIKVGDVKVTVKISSLLSDVIEVEEINIQSPEITLEGTFSGSNLGKILDNLNAAAGGAEAKKPEQPKKQKKVFIKDVVVNGGKINMSMTGLGGSAVPIPLPPVHLQNIGSKENGVTTAQAAQTIMKEVVSSVTTAASTAATDLGKGVKEIGTDTKEGANKAIEGIKGLFKK
jgi:hypothetical protein